MSPSTHESTVNYTMFSSSIHETAVNPAFWAQMPWRCCTFQHFDLPMAMKTLHLSSASKEMACVVRLRWDLLWGRSTVHVSAAGERMVTRHVFIHVQFESKLLPAVLLCLRISLRAKGTLISEPWFSTPCETRFFPREKGKMTIVEGFSLKRPFPLSRVGKIASRRR